MRLFAVLLACSLSFEVGLGFAHYCPHPEAVEKFIVPVAIFWMAAVIIASQDQLPRK